MLLLYIEIVEHLLKLDLIAVFLENIDGIELNRLQLADFHCS
jgi:hypothetical protein